MSYPVDLSVFGKPSPRVEHPRSGSRKVQTALNINRSKSLHSDIFGEPQDDGYGVRSSCKKVKDRQNEEVTIEKNKTKSATTFKKYNHQGCPPVITRAELESIRHLGKDDVANEETEKKEYTAFETARKSAPKGVPKLSLDEIVGSDDMTYTKVAEKVELESPDSKDTISWGLRMKPKTKSLNTKGGGWQVSQSRPTKTLSHKHDEVPDLDLKLSQSSDALEQLRKVVKQVDEDVQIEYMGKKGKLEELENLKKISKIKKNEVLEEAMLADQLCNININETTAQGSYSTFEANKMLDTKSRRHQGNYRSSASTGGVKGDISHRLQFSARVLSLNGHDARREITGFYFLYDKTVTMYEFRHFGTRSKALPFIRRGLYCHITPHRVGEPFEIFDFYVGQDLTFETRNQSCLPDSLKMKDFITFRIIDIDEDFKKDILSEQFQTLDYGKRLEEYLDNHLSQEYKEEKQFLHLFQSAMRKRLKSRDEKTIMNLCYHLSRNSHNDLLHKEKGREAVAKSQIAVDDQDFDEVWNILTANKGDIMDYGEFLRGFFGEMCEGRKMYVRKAFSRLDPTKSGEGMLSDIRKYYCAAKHPSVIRGKMNEGEKLDEFISSFKPSRLKTSVSYFEFELYYESVSMGIDLDEDFINLLRHTWNI